MQYGMESTQYIANSFHVSFWAKMVERLKKNCIWKCDVKETLMRPVRDALEGRGNSAVLKKSKIDQ